MEEQIGLHGLLAKMQQGGKFVSSLSMATSSIKLAWAKLSGEMHVPGYFYLVVASRALKLIYTNILKFKPAWYSSSMAYACKPS